MKTLIKVFIIFIVIYSAIAYLNPQLLDQMLPILSDVNKVAGNIIDHIVTFAEALFSSI